MFWEFIADKLQFTGVNDITVWQDIILSTFLIPLGIAFFAWLFKYIDSRKPAKSLLKGFLSKEQGILIFHSQMSGADDNWNFNPNQKYITRYPNPLPTDSTNLSIQRKLRIDPIVSQAETDCLADIYNILGRCGKIINIKSADLINDWGKWSMPTFSVGFNPKTLKLLEKCKPLDFNIEYTSSNMQLRILETNDIYTSILPNDAGVIQKTFLEGTKTPILIMAGIGTAGTSATGHILSKYLEDLGKLYSKSAFCVFIKSTTTDGKETAYIDKLTPEPNIISKMLHFPTYRKYKERFIRKKSSN